MIGTSAAHGIIVSISSLATSITRLNTVNPLHVLINSL
jgi:hypothetical protein